MPPPAGTVRYAIVNANIVGARPPLGNITVFVRTMVAPVPDVTEAPAQKPQGAVRAAVVDAVVRMALVRGMKTVTPNVPPAGMIARGSRVLWSVLRAATLSFAIVTKMVLRILRTTLRTILQDVLAGMGTYVDQKNAIHRKTVLRSVEGKSVSQIADVRTLHRGLVSATARVMG